MERLVMMPSTSITAILLFESLSSRTVSSSRGPDDEPPRCATFIGISPLNHWLKLRNKLKTSTTSSTIATIIQPRLLRGRGVGAMMTGGGGLNGGGGEATGGISLVSIMRAN